MVIPSFLASFARSGHDAACSVKFLTSAEISCYKQHRTSKGQATDSSGAGIENQNCKT